MTEQEIQKWIYEIKEVTPLEAKALLAVYSQLGISAAADRLDAVSSLYPDAQYASVWLWAIDRNRERKDALTALREELLKVYCGPKADRVHLTGLQTFYELSFFAEYETRYGTLQYYENIYRQLCQVQPGDRDGWYLYALTQIKKAMKEGVFEYQAQITVLFKETFRRLRTVFTAMTEMEKILFLGAVCQACDQKILLSYKYQGQVQEWYRAIVHQQPANDEERAAFMLMEMAKQKASL